MRNNLNIVIFTGAGISAESGISTFRDSGGLWERYKIEEVATPEAWRKNPKFVLDFYNERRKQILSSNPNKAHILLAELQAKYPQTKIITQNIDDLHERAGSCNILHLHGEIRKARSTKDESIVLPVSGWRLDLGDLCPLGSQLRPHVVWFGEEVPAMKAAIRIIEKADVLLVIGTSLNVYPAAGLIQYAPENCDFWIIDPNAHHMSIPGFKIICKPATEGVKEWLKIMNL
ncbi:MAG: SIR2 family NAD-dependent protein deacylase [Thermaurantimonas sp.]